MIFIYLVLYPSIYKMRIQDNLWMQNGGTNEEQMRVGRFFCKKEINRISKSDFAMTIIYD